MPSAPVLVPAAARAVPRAVPTATYRLQIHAGFGFDAAAEQTAYLAHLGVSHLYLSPILQAAPGSTHGYDVVDHDSISAEAGGREGFDRLVEAAHTAGLGIIVDVVPNHMAVLEQTWRNAPLWSFLREGRDSPFAHWFDVEEGQKMLMPVLGGTLEQALAAGELTVSADGGPTSGDIVLRYFAHEFPVAQGTESLPLVELVAAQPYVLTHWEEGGAALNYRRFFDVTSLIAVRVEEPDVFEATHRLLLDLHRDGAIDGFRIDHPDGLADPGGYLARLADATGDAWVVAEKILEGDERLLPSWRCAGTTGYDSMLRIQQVLTGPGGDELDQLWAGRATPTRRRLDAVVTEAKQLVVQTVQTAEVNRLLRLLAAIVPGAEEPPLRRALEALLVSMDRYRAYLVPGEPEQPEQLLVLDQAAERARSRLDPGDHDALATIHRLVRSEPVSHGRSSAEAERRELMIRFQQTCGPVMAKGIEDTAFYRWLRQTGANEVGGHPGTLSIGVDAFHDFEATLANSWPTTMTTLTTHDTKRSEDVRARLMTIAESSQAWATWVDQVAALAEPHRNSRVDPVTEYLIWQTLVGTWPITPDRLEEYVRKAVREAKDHTAWVGGDADYETAVLGFARAVASDPAVAAQVETWLSLHGAPVRANILGQKLLQLVAVGVPDVYQGGELQLLTLVDPDNRGPVDFAERRARLARLDSGARPADLDDEKLLVTATALRARRDQRAAFVGPDAGYAPVVSDSRHAIAFARGGAAEPRVVAVVTREADRLAQAGGFGSARLQLPPGQWRNLLSDRGVDTFSGNARLSEVLLDLPVALLSRQDGPGVSDR